MNKNTPKHFVVQFGAIIALYASVTALIMLLYAIINLQFPDASYSWESESARGTIRGAMAVLIVFFPTYLVLTRFSNQNRRLESNGEYLGVTRWLVYFTLLIAVGVILGDLVTLINYFLNGEITTRFIYKVFALLFVVGGVFHYYLLDVRGYFMKRLDIAAYFAYGAIALVVASLGFGYQYIETPSEVRAERLDQVQVSDLQSMQSYIENYYLMNQTLPGTLEAAYSDLPIPVAPEDRAAYTYSQTGEQTYQLCATFAAPSSNLGENYAIAPEKNYDWSHKAGAWCFERVIVVSPDMKPLPPVQVEL